MPLVLNRETDGDRLLLWRITETPDELLPLAELNDRERKYLDGLNTAKRAAEWLTVRAMAWGNFGKYIGYRQDGQPFFEDSPLHISISHTDGYAALMVSGEPCGADMERLDRRADKLLRKFATDQECESAKEAFPQNPAILIWSAKESLYKLGRKPGTEFRTELILKSISEAAIRAEVCGRKAQVSYSVFEGILITEAKYEK